eukprot:IDg8738t1
MGWKASCSSAAMTAVLIVCTARSAKPFPAGVSIEVVGLFDVRYCIGFAVNWLCYNFSKFVVHHNVKIALSFAGPYKWTRRVMRHAMRILCSQCTWMGCSPDISFIACVASLFVDS